MRRGVEELAARMREPAGWSEFVDAVKRGSVRPPRPSFERLRRLYLSGES